MKCEDTMADSILKYLTMGFIATLILVVSPSAEAVSHDVEIDTDLGTLAGTLTVPATDKPRALVLIIAGSGPTDRDGNTRGLPGNNNSLKYLAEALAGLNIASLRFDKRMIGDSASTSLSESDLRFDTYVNDALLWVRFLEQQFNAPVYIAGHSEGSLIGLLVASHTDVAGVVSIAGLGRPASQVILEQTRSQLRPDLLEETMKILSELDNGRTVGSPSPVLNALFRESVQPYLISWFRYDPSKVAAGLDVPILLLHGSTDIQVSVTDGEYILTSSKKATLKVIEGMNHVMKLVGPNMKDQIASYSDPSLPIAGELVVAIDAFIVD
jgi:alpha-beta hydrolase superfamily lysophospholipase